MTSSVPNTNHRPCRIQWKAPIYRFGRRLSMDGFCPQARMTPNQRDCQSAVHSCWQLRMRLLGSVFIALLLLSSCAAEITYTKLANTDTGTPSVVTVTASHAQQWRCLDSLTNVLARRIPVEPSTRSLLLKACLLTCVQLPPCNITVLEEICRQTCGCAGFNSNGWLKGCVNSSCGASSHHLRFALAADMYLAHTRTQWSRYIRWVRCQLCIRAVGEYHPS